MASAAFAWGFGIFATHVWSDSHHTLGRGDVSPPPCYFAGSTHGSMPMATTLSGSTVSGSALSGATRALLGLARTRYAVVIEQANAFAALAVLSAPDADLWRRQILVHADTFALGAAAPRRDFRDWRQQVLFPRDGYWGGAPAKAQLWYRNLVGALKRQEWSNAAYSAGVLSAYLGTVQDPFNTVWSEAGDGLHSAWRRSVTRDHADLLQHGMTLASSAVVLEDTPEFLARALGAAADRAAGTYEKTIAHYDLGRGTVAPSAGYDGIGRALAAERVATSVNLIAAVFARAIADSGATAPAAAGFVSRALGWLVAAPIGFWNRHRARQDDAMTVALIHDELRATGALHRFLPEAERTIRDLYKSEVEAVRVRLPIAKVFPFPQRPREAGRAVLGSGGADAAAMPATADVVQLPARRGVVAEPPRPAPQRREAPALRARGDIVRRIATEEREEAAETATSNIITPAAFHPANAPAAAVDGGSAHATEAIATDGVVTRPAAAELAEPAERSIAARLPELVAHQTTTAAATAAIETVPPAISSPAGTARVRDGDADVDPAAGTAFTVDDDIQRAPSVGARTAADFRSVGVDTLGDFARVHPIALVARLEDRTLDPALVEVWQDETRLLLTLPYVTGAQARLLVGAGFRSRDAILAADVDALCAGLLTFAMTAEGRKILQDGPPPRIEDIRAIAEAVRAVA